MWGERLRALALVLLLGVASSSPLSWLLGDAAALDEFYENYAGRTSLLVHGSRARPGATRAAWLREYRSFVPRENVDRVIGVNRSVQGGPMRYGVDVWLEQGQRVEDGWFTHRAGREGVVSMGDVREAVKAGYVMVVGEMERRSRKVMEYVVGLEKWHGVRVTAQMGFAAGSGSGRRVDFHAHDRYLVQLDGEMRVRTYALLHVDPTKNMEYAPSETQLGPVREEVLLKEGDVLYVPRGMPYEMSMTKNPLSLHVAYDCLVNTLSFRDAMLLALDLVVEDCETEGEDVLVRYVDESFSFQWVDVIRTSISVLADVTDDLRSPYFYTEEMLELLDSIHGSYSSPQLLYQRVNSFVRAGTEASSRSDNSSPLGTIFKIDGVFEPVLDVLANDPTADLYASREMQTWAVLTLNAGASRLETLLHLFRECLATYAAHLDTERVHQRIVNSFSAHGASEREQDLEQSVSACEAPLVDFKAKSRTDKPGVDVVPEVALGEPGSHVEL